MKARSLLTHGIAWLVTSGIAHAAEPAVSNVSMRSWVGPGSPAVTEFTIGPGASKTVLLRAVGPTLSTFGVKDALADPKLELYIKGGAKLAENDNFAAADDEAAAASGAFPLVAGGKDARLLTELPAGTYSMVASSADSAAGIVLVELYDMSGGSNRVSNLSAVTQMAGPDPVVISGFSIVGAGTRRMLFRAVGSSLGSFEVRGPSLDPKLEIYSGTTRVAENDNWAAGNSADSRDFFALSAATVASGALQLSASSSDAALLLDLPSGTYTLHVRGAAGAGGAVLVEAYDVPSNWDPQAVANLEITDFVTTTDFDGYFTQYYPRFRLVETTGRNGAIVISFTLRLDGGPAYMWKGRMPVPAGGSVPASGPSRNASDVIEGVGTTVLATVTYVVGDGTERVVTASTRVNFSR